MYTIIFNVVSYTGWTIDSDTPLKIPSLKWSLILFSIIFLLQIFIYFFLNTSNTIILFIDLFSVFSFGTNLYGRRNWYCIFPHNSVPNLAQCFLCLINIYFFN